MYDFAPLSNVLVLRRTLVERVCWPKIWHRNDCLSVNSAQFVVVPRYLCWAYAEETFKLHVMWVWHGETWYAHQVGLETSLDQIRALPTNVPSQSTPLAAICAIWSNTLWYMTLMPWKVKCINPSIMLNFNIFQWYVHLKIHFPHWSDH